MDSLAYTFMDQWNRFRLKRKSSQNKIKWWFKWAIIFYFIVGSCSNFYMNFHKLFSVRSLDLKILPQGLILTILWFFLLFSNRSTDLNDHYKIVNQLALNLIDVTVVNKDINENFIIVPNHDI